MKPNTHDETGGVDEKGRRFRWTYNAFLEGGRYTTPEEVQIEIASGTWALLRPGESTYVLTGQRCRSRRFEYCMKPKGHDE